VTETLPAESGAEAPRIVVTTPADQVAYAQSLVTVNEETPTEPAEPDAPEPDEGSDSESSTEETETEAKAKPPRGVQKRLDELTREKYDAQRRADAMQAQLDRAMAMLEQSRGGKAPEPAPVDVNAPPDPERYPEGELDRGYLRDMARHEARQELAMFQAEQERQRTVADIRTREDAARAKYADYNEVVSGERLAPLLQGNPGVVEILATHEQGPDLAYYLGSHPEELQALARMRPAHAAVRLGQLISTLTPQEPPATPRPVSKAPAPISPLRGSGAAPAINLDQQLEALEQAGNYDAWRALKHSARK
jgi:hypothetical protein